jgi:hypothetical protein
MTTYRSSAEFSGSMKEMSRPIKRAIEKFPKQTVNVTSNGSLGITFSLENEDKNQHADAELQVLKSILSREGYLARLKSLARTVNKKFNQEISDVLDMLRAASLDVIENIIKWREIKVLN